ncbi:MAG: hypothetical protein KME07_24630 [Pegethrix bostrychoides GSE-TBD4-15B]|jgi:hypothetical protein|uniref:Uncharacterized protein n=1 Tax=Pegethrix bostrychoides GSE-TBD4-15B TaxID=2839662 RepID=A0A951PHE8_9CYAN|nr:hypothetical protein [Pegethrix bostrychoides GSE-TBD4-15B]
MADAEGLDVLLTHLQAQQQQMAKGLTGLEQFSRVEGELPIDVSLELAVLTLAHFRYRGIPQWRVQQTYSFTCDGVFALTYVESWEQGTPIRFTPEETVVIARHLIQQEDDEW